MSNISVLLVYGGQSPEHDISLASARNVFAALDNTKYEITCCLIDRDGRWWLQEMIGDYHAGSPQLLPVLGQKKFVTLPNHMVIQPDVILPILHGKNGEDGTVQGLAELLGIPFVGPSLLGAALTMDKVLTKRVLKQAGIPVVDDVVWRTHEKRPEYSSIVHQLGQTIFVKPVRCGSSVGVSKVTNEDEFTKALDTASSHDSVVLIERAIIGRELQIAVLGNTDPRVTEICEIVIGEAFHDFEDKYNPNSTAEFYIPARVSQKITGKIKQYALNAYQITDGHGMARIDFFINDKNEVFLNEINSIPGFTSVSVYPKLWRHEGLSYPKLIAELIDLALE